MQRIKGLYFDSKHSKRHDEWDECVDCEGVHYHNNSCASDTGRFDNNDINGDFT